MRLLRILKSSVKSSAASPVRSSLALVGVAMGIGAVFVTSAIGKGAEEQILSSIGSMGSQLLVIRPAEVKKTAGRKQVRGLATSLKLDDYEAMQRLPTVSMAAPAVEGPLKIRSSHSGLLTTKVLGTTPEFLRIRSFELAEGRFFDEDENQSKERVAVLGARVKDMLFPRSDPLGQRVQIRGVPFEVVGTLQSKGASSTGADEDTQVFIPVQTALRRLFGARSLTTVFVTIREPHLMEPGEAEVRALLRQRHNLDLHDRVDDFAVQNQMKLLASKQQTRRWLTLLTSSMAAISLLLGGTGILAVMFLSIRERTPEIGLRMAVGARPKDILVQFLAEAVLLALSGGVVGVGLGFAGSWLVAAATAWQTRVSWEAVLISLSVAMAMGLIFGVFPARRASLLPPVGALSEE